MMKANGSDSRSSSSTDDLKPSRIACEPQIFYPRTKEGSIAGGGGEKSSASAADQQNVTADLLDQFTEIALRRSNRPNTYTFTKAIAESYLLDLVRAQPERYLGPRGVPVAIVRPSIVGGAWREPDVGFVDNYNGGTGAILSLYTGSLQAMPGCGQRVADVVPVDMVVNMIISTGYFLAALSSSSSSSAASSGGGGSGASRETDKQERRNSERCKIKPDRGVYIFNFVSGYRNPLRWHQVTQMIQELAYKYPSKFQVRLCGSYFVRADASASTGGVNLFALYDYLNHYWPAKLMDFCRRHLWAEQLTHRTNSLAVYGRIKQMTDTLTPFTSNQWLLCDSNVRELNQQLDTVDRQLFQFDIGNIDWPQYIRNYILGARIYTLKDEPRNVPAALRQLKRRQVAYRSSLIILAILFYYFLICSGPLESALVGSFEALSP